MLNDFEVHMEFDFELMPNNSTNEIVAPLLQVNPLSYTLGVSFKFHNKYAEAEG